MRVRMNDLASGEQDLVRALGGRSEPRRPEAAAGRARRGRRSTSAARRNPERAAGARPRMGALPRPRAPFAVLEEPARELPAREAPRSRPQRTRSAAATGVRPPPTSTTSWRSRSAPARPRASRPGSVVMPAPVASDRLRPGIEPAPDLIGGRHTTPR